MYLPKHGKWPSQHLYLKINSEFHARKNPKQQYLKVVTFSDPSFSENDYAAEITHEEKKKIAHLILIKKVISFIT